MPLPLGNEIYLFVGPSIAAADATYMKSYFGVSPREAVGTSLTPFTPGGGLKNASFGATATWLISEHWLFLVDAAYERLLDDAARSPVVETRTQFTLGLDIIYHF